MKVAAVFQIYLPYYLPRTPEWSEGKHLQFHFDVEGHLVNIHPRKVDEKLFPEGIDEQLAEAKIKMESGFIVPMYTPTEIAVRDRCFDRLEAQVYGEVATRDDCAKQEVNRAYQRLAIGGCNKFLSHCRIAGRDPDIRTLIWHYNFEDNRCYFDAPYSLIWYDAESKQPLCDDNGKIFWAAQGGSVRSPLRKPIELGAINRSFKLGDKESLPVRLIVSAKEHLIAERLHEGIINIASACEIAFTQYIERKGMSKDAKIKTILKTHLRSFAEKRFHMATLHIDGKSLKINDADAFEMLEKAYLTRNSLVHSGELAYKDPTSKTNIIVTRSMTVDLSKGCERAIDWIESL